MTLHWLQPPGPAIVLDPVQPPTQEGEQVSHVPRLALLYVLASKHVRSIKQELNNNELQVNNQSLIYKDFP